MNMNLRLLPQNKTLFGSDLLVKFSFLNKNVCQQFEHFHGNRGYHFKEESVLSILAPRLAGGVDGERRRDAMNERLGHAPPPLHIDRRQARY